MLSRKLALASIMILAFFITVSLIPVPSPEMPGQEGVIKIQEGLIKTNMLTIEIPVPIKAFTEVIHEDGRKEILYDPFNTNADPRYLLMFTYLYKQFASQINLRCTAYLADAYLYHIDSFSSPRPDNLLSFNSIADLQINCSGEP